MALLAAFVCPAHATLVSEAYGTVTFSNFQDLSGNKDAKCSVAFSPLGLGVCEGLVLDPGIAVTGKSFGVGSTHMLPDAQPGVPIVTAELHISGGDGIVGFGGAGVTTDFHYFVAVVPRAFPPPVPVDKIPLLISDAGGFFGDATNGSVSGEAFTKVWAVLGDIVVDGSQSTVADAVSNTVDNGLLLNGFHGRHSILFDLSGGETVAEVDMRAACRADALTADFGSVDCSTGVDPILGFDQVAFDKMMGASTFPLYQYFWIDLSRGVRGNSLPEPSTLFLLAAGLGFLLLRARRGSMC